MGSSVRDSLTPDLGPIVGTFVDGSSDLIFSMSYLIERKENEDGEVSPSSRISRSPYNSRKLREKNEKDYVYVGCPCTTFERHIGSRSVERGDPESNG